MGVGGGVQASGRLIMKITVDNYGNELAVAPIGRLVSSAHQIVTESAGSRSSKGSNWRGPYHYKCLRSDLVWHGKASDAPVRCRPHLESDTAGWVGGQTLPMYTIAKSIDNAWKHVYRMR